MPEPQVVPNPFELMMNPEAVLRAIENSQRLEGLQRRVYRPLDKPLIAKKQAPDSVVREREVELADDETD